MGLLQGPSAEDYDVGHLGASRGSLSRLGD